MENAKATVSTSGKMGTSMRVSGSNVCAMETVQISLATATASLGNTTLESQRDTECTSGRTGILTQVISSRV